MSKKIIITNFGALTVMQAVQYIVPLIVLPYLVRVVGPAKFGIISFAQAIAYYFALLPDIGTNL
ncbi:MAG TPA: oligosaccharide flippase family protein, partial [Deltaproteobacteria bacterium]|nr:oligosaccharide flippase family protein [Deltaproteobacteria bacterium]